MTGELNGQQANMGDETLNPEVDFVIVRNWDKTVESLQQQGGLEALTSKMGFDLPTLVATLNREFPKDSKPHSEYNAAGEKTEDDIVETIIVNGRPLDRILVTDYPPAARANPSEMTRFKYGGEVILVTDGEAEIAFATRVTDGFISKADLKSEMVRKGDLIISTDTPNNWTRVHGAKFTFIYFVGNPNGPQKYAEIPKDKVPVK